MDEKLLFFYIDMIRTINLHYNIVNKMYEEKKYNKININGNIFIE